MTDLRARAAAHVGDYTVVDWDKRKDHGCSEEYDVLVGPNFESVLTEPEDRGWLRDGRDVIVRLNEQSALIRDLLAALPPDPAPTGERRPCAGWRPHGTAADILPLDGNGVSDCRLWAIATNSRHGDVAWAVSMQSFDDDDEEMRIAAGIIDSDMPTAEAIQLAKLAAESAAAELLRAGLRALGRVK